MNDILYSPTTHEVEMIARTTSAILDALAPVMDNKHGLVALVSMGVVAGCMAKSAGDSEGAWNLVLSAAEQVLDGSLLATEGEG